MDVSSAKPPQTSDNNNDNKDEKDKQVTDKEILVQLKEILIDCEWQKRITEQASQKIEQQTLQRREELKAKIAAQKQYKKEWEEGRNSRVSSWRDWQTKDKKKKKKKKKKKPIVEGQKPDRAPDVDAFADKDGLSAADIPKSARKGKFKTRRGKRSG
eukprot:CAMPEP_0201578092 /NCGR_PEP_ID=MMETSP0190_2-20130828/24801_1 /ASSEMBLY_ACC=CAM_ASM_000263 /TAXON_ID=37353 /ORGANISM="Rosalina sp." /LENGTH=156 /DNA_ID=CAMNT_0048010887 /DNA_START=524 /DNA_END=990 /DNA_ORIENTATION=+